MPFYDWLCEKGHKEETWTDISKVPRIRACSRCGAPSKQLFTGPRNFIHGTHSSRYGKYDPMLGTYIEDYAHKQQVMRQQGVEEANDSVKGARSYLPGEYTGDKAKDDRPKRRAKDKAQWVTPKDLQ